MSARRSSRSRSKPRSKRDGEGSGSESESAPAPSPAELSSEEEEFAESQQAGARVLERAEELEKIKKQQREAGEELAALWQLDAVALNPRREPAWLQPVLVLLSTRHLIGAVARAWSMLA